MARGYRLNTSIVLAAVHGLSGLFRAVSAVEPSLCRPLPTLSLSLISHLASVDVKQQRRKDVHLDFHTAPELCVVARQPGCLFKGDLKETGKSGNGIA